MAGRFASIKAYVINYINARFALSLARKNTAEILDGTRVHRKLKTPISHTDMNPEGEIR